MPIREGHIDKHSPLFSRRSTSFILEAGLPHLTNHHDSIRGLSSSYPANKAGLWAEEQTFWAFTALIRDFEGVIPSDIANHGDGETLPWALEYLARRVNWADQHLSTFSRDRNLDPASPLYAYRWISHLFALDIPGSGLLRVWDFVLAEDLDGIDPSTDKPPCRYQCRDGPGD